MRLFHTDLDNTLIYSYKHDIGAAKRCAEVYQGRNISFLTDTTYELLCELKNTVSIVPTTTRTMEQYQRIDLGIGSFRYALVCNGGVLLEDGIEDVSWYKETFAMISDSSETLSYGEILLERDENRCMEVRNIRGLFLFTKSKKAPDSIGMLKKSLDMNYVDVFCNGEKVYVVPKKLTKGTALCRLKEKLSPECVIAAGDSEFDFSMLNCADLALAPKELSDARGLCSHVRYMEGRRLFSEEMLWYIKNYLSL